MNFIFICLRSLHLFIMVVYKDVNTCSSANLSINHTEVSKFMCTQNLSTDRQTEGETLGDSKMPPSQHFICRGIIKAYATKA